MATDPAPPPAPEKHTVESRPRRSLLESATIMNCRRFQKFRMDGLKRVNLFVGENGAGKTTLVEALLLLQVGGHHNLFLDVATRRAELAPARPLGDEKQVWTPHAERWLSWSNSPAFPESLLINGDGGPTKSVELKVERVVTQNSAIDINLAAAGFDLDPARRFIVSFVDRQDASVQVHYRLSKSGALLPGPETTSVVPDAGTDSPVEKPSSLLMSGTGGVAQRFAVQVWARVKSSKEKRIRVTEALDLLRSDITRLELDPTDFPPDSIFGIQNFSVELADAPAPVKVGSLGGGASHCLQVALGLAYAEGGSLGIDEIDAGIHYAAMAKFWHFLVESARRYNVQVFATTHSWDCIEGLAEACRRDESFLPEVAVHSIHRHLPESLPHDGESILDISRYNLDPR